jgi:hypothetical protein
LVASCVSDKFADVDIRVRVLEFYEFDWILDVTFLEETWHPNNKPGRYSQMR